MNSPPGGNGSHHLCPTSDSGQIIRLTLQAETGNIAKTEFDLIRVVKLIEPALARLPS